MQHNRDVGLLTDRAPRDARPAKPRRVLHALGAGTATRSCVRTARRAPTCMALQDDARRPSTRPPTSCCAPARIGSVRGHSLFHPNSNADREHLLSDQAVSGELRRKKKMFPDGREIGVKEAECPLDSASGDRADLHRRCRHRAGRSARESVRGSRGSTTRATRGSCTDRRRIVSPARCHARRSRIAPIRDRPDDAVHRCERGAGHRRTPPRPAGADAPDDPAQRVALCEAGAARGEAHVRERVHARRYLDAKRPRFGATTHMVMASGVRSDCWRTQGADELTLSHDYTGAWITARGYPVKARTAGRRGGARAPRRGARLRSLRVLPDRSSRAPRHP